MPRRTLILAAGALALSACSPNAGEHAAVGAFTGGAFGAIGGPIGLGVGAGTGAVVGALMPDGAMHASAETAELPDHQ